MADWPYPFWMAHRGAGKQAPENTLAAFRIGAGFGYRAFECDVKLSADGVPFLLHDDTLERTTNGQGIAGERSWAELSKLDAGRWHSRSFSGEPIPTLEAIARFCLGSGLALNIEIKPTPGTEFETGHYVAALAAMLWAPYDTVPPLLSSFQPAALEGARAAAPTLPRALLRAALGDDWLAQAQVLQCVAVVAEQALIDGGVIDRLHAAGLRALAYTVNDAAAVQRLCALQIDGLVTDAIDRFVPDGNGRR